MSFLTRLSEKSWEAPGAHAYRDPGEYRPAAAAVGLYVYMGVVVFLFLLMTAAYVMRMGGPGIMDHGTNDWQPLPDPLLLWINTGVLIASSVSWEQARRLSLYGKSAAMRRMALLGAALALLFLAGQLLLWRHYHAQGYFLAANPANAFFYLLTTMHGLHMIGGLVACGIVLRPQITGAEDSRTAPNIRLCAVYWHFLLLVWLFLAGLLLFT